MVHGPGDVRLDEVDKPSAGHDDVVIQLKAAGICGSDFTYVANGGAMRTEDKPFGLGHEFGGGVVEAGANVTAFRVGERVAYNSYNSPADLGRASEQGGFSHFLVMRDIDRHPQSLVRIPEDVSFEHAALVEPLSVSMHAVNRAAPQPGERAAIFGVGPIGLGMVQVLKMRGIEQIVAFDLSPLRRQLALDMGAIAAFDPRETPLAQALGDTFGYGDLRGFKLPLTEMYFETTGAPGVFDEIIRSCYLGSRIISVAIQKGAMQLDGNLLGKELTILGSLGYPTEFPKVVDCLSQGTIRPSAMITDRFPIDDFIAAFEHARKSDQSGKVLLTFD
jgi:threonine dehydrogenase-like Zn-dependent dehydrogenase